MPLMTVDEYLQLPDPHGCLELHHGEPVLVPLPHKQHVAVEQSIIESLHPLIAGKAVGKSRLPFQPVPEYEVWVADYGLVLKDRWNADESPLYFQGAPDLVIEVTSPTDTWDAVNEKERICLANGCKSFWIADPKFREIHVTGTDRVTRVYSEGTSIPFPPPLEGSVAVTDIFADI